MLNSFPSYQFFGLYVLIIALKIGKSSTSNLPPDAFLLGGNETESLPSPAQLFLHRLDPDHIRIPALAGGVAAGHDHGVAVVEVQDALGLLEGEVVEHVHARELLGQQRHHAPGESQLVPGALAGGKAEDRDRRAEARDHAHREAADGRDHNGLRVKVDGHGAGRVGDGVHPVVDGNALRLEEADIVDVALGLLGDLAHDAHGVHRVLARGGLAGEHDGAGAVIDGVGHVADFGAGGAGIGDHALEHFGRGDDALAEHAALGDEVFLDGGQLRERHLDAEVAAGDHDALADGADLVDVIHAGLVLDLRDHVNVSAAVCLEEGLEIDDVLLAGDEGGRDEVHAVADAEEQILAVLLAHIGLAHDLAGEGHALAVGEDAAGDDGAADLAALDGLDLEDHEAVVHEDAVPDGEIVGQARVAHGDDALVALDVAGGEGEIIPVLEGDFAVLEGADAVLGALGVEHDGDGQAQLRAHGLDHVDLLLVLLMGAVGKIQAGDIQALQAHGLENRWVFAGRSDGADDLGFSHGDSPSL